MTAVRCIDEESTDGPIALLPAPRSSALLLARIADIPPTVAVALLERYGSLGALRHIDASVLCAAHDLTLRQVGRLRESLDLATSLLVEPREERPQVRSPRDTASLVLPEMGLLEAEQMRVLLLDTKNRLIAAVTLYSGTVSECRVRIAEVFREAVRRNAVALILLHNHPSGASEPSPEDVRITREVVQAGRLLDVNVLDHLVIARSSFTSLRERGLGWS